WARPPTRSGRCCKGQPGGRCPADNCTVTMKEVETEGSHGPQSVGQCRPMTHPRTLRARSLGASPRSRGRCDAHAHPGRRALNIRGCCKNFLRSYPETLSSPCRSDIKQLSGGNETQDDYTEQAYSL